MLIRLVNEQLIECPDELGAFALADPSQGDVPDFSLDEVNLLLNIIVASLFDEGNSLEENIEHARKQLSIWGTPDPANMEKALAQIKHYNENMAVKDIGYSDRDLVHDALGIQRSNKDDVYVIDQQAREVGNVLELGSGQPHVNEPGMR